MKKILAGLIALVAFAVLPLFAPKQIVWEGGVDIDWYKQLKATTLVPFQTVEITITSPGGPMIPGFMIVDELRKLEASGHTVKVHATGLCASMCTFLLAAGTPGHRTIDKHTVFLVHPPQMSSGFGQTCVKLTPVPKEVDEKAGNVVLQMFRDYYVQLTGQPAEVVAEWSVCGNEKVGQGQLAVDMKIADKVE